jgi:16S rRNA (guanine966-N2)-methyltransferase
VKRREPRKKRHDSPKPLRTANDAPEIAGLRIIGGTFRGRKLKYSGDIRTRPMKDRLREAVFNLVGTDVKGAHAIDLFAGTGALGLEALSRGAERATFLEQHYPTAAIIKQNIAALEVADACEVVPGNTFIWFKRQLKEAEKKGTVAFCQDQPSVDGRSESVACKMPLSPFFRPNPWVVFCSPPYDFYVERTAEMLELLSGMLAVAPPKSVFVVEADARFDFQHLPEPEKWDVRGYSPAVVGVMQKLP